MSMHASGELNRSGHFASKQIVGWRVGCSNTVGGCFVFGGQEWEGGYVGNFGLVGWLAAG
jgi:hypothetical protein